MVIVNVRDMSSGRVRARVCVSAVFRVRISVRVRIKAMLVLD
jgi:hypothetical protein